MKCKHMNFRADVAVNRLTASEDDSDTIVGYSADIKIRCTECDTPFEFIGLGVGMMPTEPMCSFNFQEARMPIKPKGENMPMDLAGFKLRIVDGEESQ